MGGDAILKNAGLDSTKGFQGGMLFLYLFVVLHRVLPRQSYLAYIFINYVFS